MKLNILLKNYQYKKYKEKKIDRKRFKKHLTSTKLAMHYLTVNLLIDIESF